MQWLVLCAAVLQGLSLVLQEDSFHREPLLQPGSYPCCIIETSRTITVQLQHCCVPVDVTHEARQEVTFTIDEPVACTRSTDSYHV